MSGTLLCRNDTQCRPRFGDIDTCRRHVGDMSATCGAKYFKCSIYSGEYVGKVFLKYNTGEHKVAGIFVRVTHKIPDSCVMAK